MWFTCGSPLPGLVREDQEREELSRGTPAEVITLQLMALIDGLSPSAALATPSKRARYVPIADAKTGEFEVCSRTCTGAEGCGKVPPAIQWEETDSSVRGQPGRPRQCLCEQ